MFTFLDDTSDILPTYRMVPIVTLQAAVLLQLRHVSG